MGRWMYIVMGMLLLFVLVACTNEAGDDPLFDAEKLATFSVNQTEDVAEDEHFSLKLDAGKAVYEAGEPLQLTTEITYIGALEQVEVVHGSSAVLFQTEEKVREYRLGSMIREIGSSTVLQRGESMSEPFQMTGDPAWEDDQDYDAFVDKLNESGGMLPGYYVVEASTEIYVRELDDYVKLQATVDFIVKE